LDSGTRLLQIKGFIRVTLKLQGFFMINVINNINRVITMHHLNRIVRRETFSSTGVEAD